MLAGAAHLSLPLAVGASSVSGPAASGTGGGNGGGGTPLAGSPTESEGGGFAFAGAAECPTPLPLGQAAKRQRLTGGGPAGVGFTPTQLFSQRLAQQLPTLAESAVAAAPAQPGSAAAPQHLAASQPAPAVGAGQVAGLTSVASARVQALAVTGTDAPAAARNSDPEAANAEQPLASCKTQGEPQLPPQQGAQKQPRPKVKGAPAAAASWLPLAKAVASDPRSSPATPSAAASDAAVADHMAVLEGILSQLQLLDQERFFVEPVPPSVPGYYERVRNPKCFQDMHAAVQARSYHTWRQLTADFDLIVANALAFNQKGDIWHTAAGTLKCRGSALLKAAEVQGRAAMIGLHPGGRAAALAEERAEVEAGGRGSAASSVRRPASLSSPSPPLQQPAQAAPGGPRGTPGALAPRYSNSALATAGGLTFGTTPSPAFGRMRSTSLSSAAATDSGALASGDAAAALVAAADGFATDAELHYTSFSDPDDSGNESSPDFGSLFSHRRQLVGLPASLLQGSRGQSRAGQPLGGHVLPKRLAAVQAHLQLKTVDLPWLDGVTNDAGGHGNSVETTPTAMPRRQKGKPTKAAILTAEATRAAEARKAEAAAVATSAGVTAGVAPGSEEADGSGVLSAAAADTQQAGAGAQGGQRCAIAARSRRMSRVWRQERDSVAWRAEFLRLRMRALRHEQQRLSRAGAAMQARSQRMCGPGTPPQAGMPALPDPAPLPPPCKRRRKRAPFPHLGPADLSEHPVLGAHANLGRPPLPLLAATDLGRSSSAAAAQEAAAAASASVYRVFPAAASDGGSGGADGGAGAGRALPPALRLLRSNAEAFSDSPSAGHSPTGGSESRSGRLQIPSRAAEASEVSPGTGGSGGGGSSAGGGSDVGGPARAARERARRNSAVQASLVKMGAAGGTPAEAAYAAAAAAAADGPTVDDTWYAARASATLDAIKHRQSDNREIVNSIMQSDQAQTEPQRRTAAAAAASAAAARGRGGGRPGSARGRVSGQPTKPSKRRRDDGYGDPGTPLTATGIGAPKFVERQKAMEIAIPDVRPIPLDRQERQRQNMERFRSELKARKAAEKARGKSSKAASKAAAAGSAAATAGVPEGGGADVSDASDEESFHRRHAPLELEERHRFLTYSSGAVPGSMKARAKGGGQKPKPISGGRGGARPESAPARTATAPPTMMGPPAPKEVKKGGVRRGSQGGEKQSRGRKGPPTPTAAALVSAAAATAAKAGATPLTAAAAAAQPATAVSQPLPAATTAPVPTPTAVPKAPPK